MTDDEVGTCTPTDLPSFEPCHASTLDGGSKTTADIDGTFEVVCGVEIQTVDNTTVNGLE